MINKVAFKYNASKALIEREIIETGQSVGEQRELIADLADLTPEQRQVVVAAGERGMSLYSVSLTKRTFLHDGNVVHKDNPISYTKDERVEVNEPLTITTAVNLARKIYAEKFAAQAEAKRRVKEYRTAVAQERERQFTNQLELATAVADRVNELVAGDDLEAIEAYELPAGLSSDFPSKFTHEFRDRLKEAGISFVPARERLNGRARELRDARDLAEKDAWIKAHGSDHLRRAWAAGHHSGRQYAIERAAFQYPGWTLDYNETSEWSSRSFPSVAALDLLEEAKAAGYSNPEIVWLTVRPSNDITAADDRYYLEMEEDEECEAVVFFDPHLKRCLVREVV